MSDSPREPTEKPLAWLNDYEDMANEQLDHGSSCDQVHPIMRRWFERLLAGEPPESRDSVIQATSCLATEVLLSSPDFVVDPIVEQVGEEELAIWVEQIILIGRAFEIALRDGTLDDL